MAKNKSINDFLSKIKSTLITYDDLVEIKSNIVNTREGTKLIMKNNLLKDLVNLLDKPNEKILDMTLSILGNCCMDEDFRKEVVCLGIVKKLSYVLHNIAKDSIQCRACRLAGNLAQESIMAEDLLQENTAADIVSMLETTSKSSTATKQMAVRALRMLWNVKDQRLQMLKVKAVRAVSLLLNLNQKKADERELLKGIIKALVTFSSDHSVQCAEQIYGEGSTFKHLVALTADLSLRKSVLLIICNLCHTDNARPGLGSAGAVQLVIRELKHHEENNLGLFTELVRALCFFCNESVNRAAIRYAGGLPLILEISRTTSTKTVIPFILQALTQFMYDDMSLQELSKGGLVSILVEKIALFNKDHGRVHRYITMTKENLYVLEESYYRHGYRIKSRTRERCTSGEKERETPKQRFRANSPSYQEVVREQGNSSRCSYQCGISCDKGCKSESPTEKHFLLFDNFYSGDWSPGSPTSMWCSPDSSPSRRGNFAWSPSNSGLSPSTSPNPTVNDEFEYPEVYSPICSEQDDDDFDVDIIVNNENIKDNDNTDDIIDVEEVDDEDFIPSDEFGKNSIMDSKEEHNILCSAFVLLSRLSCMDSPLDELASHSTLSALLDYLTLVENPEPRALRILFRIIRNHHYFMSLVQNRFILTIQTKLFDLAHSHYCCKCIHFRNIGFQLYSDIRNLAHSGFGEGELAHQLLKAEEPIQRVLAISVPYIVRIQKLLIKLLMDCGGLRTMINILKTDIKEDDDFLNYIPVSLKFLGSSLKIPKVHSNNNAIDQCLYEFNEEYPADIQIELPNFTDLNTNKLSDDTVSLVLDDGSAVNASRSFLSLQSPVFEAMFRGDFKESQEERVSLPDVSLDCLINVFRIAKYGRVSKHMTGINLDISLELVAILDRFLIPGSEDISKIIVERFLTVSNALDIYTKCMEAGDVLHFHKLRHETVKFVIMSGEMTEEIKKLYMDILKNPYKLQILTDITDVLEERLR